MSYRDINRCLFHDYVKVFSKISPVFQLKIPVKVSMQNVNIRIQNIKHNMIRTIIGVDYPHVLGFILPLNLNSYNLRRRHLIVFEFRWQLSPASWSCHCLCVLFSGWCSFLRALLYWCFFPWRCVCFFP